MKPTAIILPFDKSRARKGMRDQALEIVNELLAPGVAEAWKSPAEAGANKITPQVICASLGPIDQLWHMDDLEASARIIHLTILTLYSIQSGQFDKQDVAELCMRCQAAATAVRDVVKTKRARKAG